MNLNELHAHPRSRRVIDQLRKDYPGEWSYDRDMNEWVRSDGAKVYARAHFSSNENGCESWYTRWYIERDGKVETLYGIGRPRRKR